MTFIPEDLVAQFRVVAVQRIDRIESAWETLLKAVDENAAQTLHRELHTLKGEAQFMAFGEVNLVCHKLEDLLAAARNNGYAVDDEFDLSVNMAIRFLGMLVRKRVGASLSGLDIPGFVKQIDKLLVGSSQGFNQRTRTGASLTPIVTTDALPPTHRARLSPPASDLFIEYAIARGQRRNRLRAAWHVMRQAVGLQRATLAPDQLHKHVLGARAIARDLGKRVQVRLEVAPVEITSDVFAAADVALMHLIRNAIDHGIESPAERIAAGKSEAGTIVLAAELGNGSLKITVTDDGRGLDIARVRARAIELGLVAEGVDLPRERWVEVLWQPGFSTRDSATATSGRGIGLDAVHSSITSIGGTLDAISINGQGMKWTMQLPVPSTTVRGMAVQVTGIPFPFLLEGWESAPPSDTAVPVDPARMLGLSETPATGTPATFVRAGKLISISVTNAPRLTDARRLVATGQQNLYEVVLLDTREGLLLRPELLLT